MLQSLPDPHFCQVFPCKNTSGHDDYEILTQSVLGCREAAKLLENKCSYECQESIKSPGDVHNVQRSKPKCVTPFLHSLSISQHHAWGLSQLPAREVRGKLFGADCPTAGALQPFCLAHGTEDNQPLNNQTLT